MHISLSFEFDYSGQQSFWIRLRQLPIVLNLSTVVTNCFESTTTAAINCYESDYGSYQPFSKIMCSVHKQLAYRFPSTSLSRFFRLSSGLTSRYRMIDVARLAWQATATNSKLFMFILLCCYRGGYWNVHFRLLLLQTIPLADPTSTLE